MKTKNRKKKNPWTIIFYISLTPYVIVLLFAALSLWSGYRSLYVVTSDVKDILFKEYNELFFGVVCYQILYFCFALAKKFKGKRPPYFILKPSEMSGLTYHALIFISLFFAVIMPLGISSIPDVNIYMIIVFITCPIFNFTIGVSFYNLVFSTPNSERARRENRIFTPVMNVLSTLFYTACVIISVIFFAAICENDMKGQGSITTAMVFMAAMWLFVVLFIRKICNYRRYVKAMQTCESFIEPVQKYLLEKYSDIEFIKNPTEYYFGFLKESATSINKYAYYEFYNDFYYTYCECKTGMPKQVKFERFPENAADNFCIFVVCSANSDKIKVSNNLQYYKNGFVSEAYHKYLVYVENGEITDILTEYLQHRKVVAENTEIEEYVREKHTDVAFKKLKVREIQKMPAMMMFFPKETELEKYDLSGNIIAAVKVETEKEKDGDVENLTFTFNVTKVNDTFMDNFQQMYETAEEWEYFKEVDGYGDEDLDEDFEDDYEGEYEDE